eukprot:Ihof_evm2s222 gene=Ihof_evmTU2s222
MRTPLVEKGAEVFSGEVSPIKRAYVLTVQLNYLNSHTEYRLEQSREAPPQCAEPMGTEGSCEDFGNLGHDHSHKGRRIYKPLECSKSVRSKPYKSPMRRHSLRLIEQ